MARILIADDEEAIRSLIARGLRQDGHEVMTEPMARMRWTCSGVNGAPSSCCSATSACP